MSVSIIEGDLLCEVVKKTQTKARVIGNSERKKKEKKEAETEGTPGRKKTSQGEESYPLIQFNSIQFYLYSAFLQ